MNFTIQETTWLGKEGYHYGMIDSTNIRAKALAKGGCSHGTLVLADAQEAGMGRRGRSWSSERGEGIYMSIVLKPEGLEADKAPMLTLVAALAVAKAIHIFTKDSELIPFIKWPNDIILRCKKVCGILTELSMDEKEIESIIVGIGINVHNNAFPEELALSATSIEMELGHEVDKERLIKVVALAFEKYYGLFMKTGDLSLLMDSYQEVSANKGRKVTVLDPKGNYEGTAKGITNTGELIVDTGTETRLVSGGEVSVRGIYGYV